MNVNFKATRSVASVIFLAALCLPINTDAVVLVTYDIATANAANDSTLSPSAIAGVTASDLSLTGVTPASAPGAYIATGWPTSASTPDLVKYIEFTVAPAGGNQITFASLTGSAWRAAGNPVTVDHGANQFQLRSSADSFGSAIGSTLDLTLTEDAEQTPFTFNLSGLGTRTGSTTFRLYAYNEADPIAGAGLANNNGVYVGSGGNLALNGAVTVVPEPRATTVMIGLALICFTAVTRTLFPAK